VFLRDIAVESTGTGVICSEAAGVTFQSVTVSPDAGPAMEVSDTRDLEVLRFRAGKANAGQPVIKLEGVQNAVVESSSAAAGNDVFVEVAGTANENVQLLRNRVPAGAKAVSLTGGASDSVVTERD
jgi:hypothetical protein